MAANLATLEKALKTLYKDTLIGVLNTEVDPFAARIVQKTDGVTGNNGIVRAAIIGLNGGFGAGTETGELPAPGENIYKNLQSTTKNLYGVISVSDKMLRAANAGANAGAFAALVEEEIKNMIATAKWQFGRQIYGSHTGKLAKCTGNGASSSVIGVDSTQFLMPGMTIDIVSSSGAVQEGKKGLRVMDVNHDTDEIRIAGAGVSVADGDFITNQRSYNLEMTGLADIFDLTTESLYGNKRAENSWLNPYVKTGVGEISQSMLQDVITRCENYYRATIDYINCGDEAYNHYMEMLKAESRQVNTTKLKGGVSGLKFNEIDVVRNQFAPKDGMQFLDTNRFVIDQVADWDWIEGPTRNILQQVGNTPTYHATMVKYADLMCLTPGAMAQLTGMTAPV